MEERNSFRVTPFKFILSIVYIALAIFAISGFCDLINAGVALGHVYVLEVLLVILSAAAAVSILYPFAIIIKFISERIKKVNKEE